MCFLAFRSEITKKYDLNNYLFEKIRSHPQDIKNLRLIESIPIFLINN